MLISLSLPASSEHTEAILFLLPPAPAPLPPSPPAPIRPSDSSIPHNPTTPDASANSNPSPPGPPPQLDAHPHPSHNPSATPNSSPSSSPTPASTSTLTSASAQGPLVMAYYPDWVGSSYPPENMDFSRFDWIDFAFAIPDQNMALNWDGSDDAPNLLMRVVSRAHASGKRVKLSVGGWTGSKYFSSAVTTPENRAVFANNLLALYRQYNLDGIDLDWEYPGQEGEKGNGVSPSDSANFLEFFRLLRATLPPEAKITAATQTVPFANTDGNPMRDLSDFAKVLDWVLLMNYDTWGSSSEPGPNAPLSDACGNSSQPNANALAALRAWTAAGFAPSQLVLGVPSYGYLSRSSATHLQTRALRSAPRILDPDSGPGSGSGLFALQGTRTRARRGGLLDVELTELVDSLSPDYRSNMVVNEDGGTDNGQVQFRELPRRFFAGGNGFVREWDRCSSTPFLRSQEMRQIVTYDDPASLEMKAQLVRQVGMLGVNMFDIHGDTDEWDLTDALRRGLGLL
ncbi:hypothetical protein V8D89_005890 [Ganoderma adspersum]